MSIVIPVYDDEEWVSSAIQSCLNQTAADVEVICVDDASSDASCEIIERIRREDPRVALIRQQSNRSAFQARKLGIQAAAAPFVMFLDGDDELVPDAVETALASAVASDADVVGFGVEVVVPNGAKVGKFASDMQPKYEELIGHGIVTSLFPAGKIAQGHLWRYLWSASLLRRAYDGIDDDLTLYRANDIPIAFMALARAEKYVSTKRQLYRYYWRRGVSGRSVESTTDYDFYLGALESIDCIRSSVDEVAAEMDDATLFHESYRSARLSIIQMILRYCTPIADDALRAECFSMLEERAGILDIILAVATFYRDALPVLAENLGPAPSLVPSGRTVLITLGNLGSGGVQGVAVAQAKHMVDAGYRVVVAVRTLDGLVQDVPEGVELVEISGRSLRGKLESYMRICEEYDVDTVIDHYILYYDDWPFFALAARTMNVPFIGWIHNFALRPVFDFNNRSSFLARYLELLSTVVVLSPTDVAYWKLQGIERVVWLPNPGSPLLLDLPERTEPREAPTDRIKLVWWGRLQQHTKRVRDLVDVAAAIRARGVDFELTVIGPNSGDLKLTEVEAHASKKGVGDAVNLTGTLHGEELLSAIDAADVFVTTSAIEGYPLVLLEAQAMGLPVAMYELPWLAAADGNDGIVASRQGDVRQLAAEIVRLAERPEEYRRRSSGSLAATRRALEYDFAAMYTAMLTGSLPAQSSPEPTVADAKLLLALTIDFHESSAGRETRYMARLRDAIDREARTAKQLRDKIDRLSRELDAERIVATEREQRIARLSRRNRRETVAVPVSAQTKAERESEPRVVRGVRPLGRALLRIIPGLRPAARQVNRLLRRL